MKLARQMLLQGLFKSLYIVYAVDVILDVAFNAFFITMTPVCDATALPLTCITYFFSGMPVSYSPGCLDNGHFSCCLCQLWPVLKI